MRLSANKYYYTTKEIGAIFHKTSNDGSKFMNNTIEEMIRNADRYDQEHCYDESERVDDAIIKMAQYGNSPDTSSYDQQGQAPQPMYQPNTRAFGDSPVQPLTSVPSYGAHVQSGLSHDPYMQYFLNYAEKLLMNTIDMGYKPAQSYQYVLNLLPQMMQQKRVPQSVMPRIISAFNDWVRYTFTQINTGEYPEESYYAKQYPQRSYITTRRPTTSPRGQYGRTRFFR